MEPIGQGQRRQKLAGYLRAANELRQTYQQSYIQSRNNRGIPDDSGVPGSYPSANTAAWGESEMVIFPSYARRHVKHRASPSNGAAGSIGDLELAANPDHRPDIWQEHSEQEQADSSVVEVDVRGWIYTRQHGPMTRKHRLYVSMARQVLGLPAPPGEGPGTYDSSHSEGLHDKLANFSARHEEELAYKEAESIVKRGEAEAEIARRGGYSEDPSGYESDPSRSNSPLPFSDDGTLENVPSSAWSSAPGNQSPTLAHRTTFSNPAQMTATELKTANANLLSRLGPFLATPLMSTTVSAFFYNETTSRQRTIMTDASGHFSARVELDFIPTHVRVLATANLSATAEVHIIESQGVSVISDIDDTVKHSAINSGAREIFRNAFIREANELTVDGVSKWYRQLASAGATFHYVSNSPWQLFPVLIAFFNSSHIPSGSFHLRKYTGVFQGIFEPVAERKKGPLKKILRDFPQRRFILIGDSGEADLEVYTDIALEHPGRILGVFIRDITTMYKAGTFDAELGPLVQGRSSGRQSVQSLTPRASQEDLFPRNSDQTLRDQRSGLRNSINNTPDEHKESAASEKRPPLPPRQPSAPAAPEEDLIDLNFDDDVVKPSQQSPNDKKNLPPPRPVKPRSLSSTPVDSTNTNLAPTKSAPPPLPRKPSSSVMHSIQLIDNEVDQEMDTPPPKPPRPLPTDQQAQEKSGVTLFNKLGSSSAGAQQYASSHDRSPIIPASQPRNGYATGSRNLNHASGPPPVPPRKPLLSVTRSDSTRTNGSATSATSSNSANSLYTSTASRPTTTTTNGLRHAASLPLSYLGSSANTSNNPNSMASSTLTTANKREDMWRRRWLHARDILASTGVVLRVWRVGEDVAETAVQLVKKEVDDEKQH